jgi:hypothetical protein
MNVPTDISPIVQALVGAAATIVPVLAGIVVVDLKRYFKIGNDAATATRIQSGVDALSDIALSMLQEAASKDVKVSVPDVVAEALKSASDGLVAATVRQGTSPEMLAARVTGSLIQKATAAPPVKPVADGGVNAGE